MKRKKTSYTLVELLIATTVLTVILAALIPLMVFVVRTVAKARAQADLEMQSMIAQEWIKRDLRRTSRSEIVMWPSYTYTVDDEDITYTGNSICISFPILNRGPEETSLPLNADGEIEWDQTIVYHVSYNYDTGKSELRRTVFDPRDNSLTSYQRLVQCVYTYWYGEGSQAYYNTENASTKTLIDDIRNYRITSGVADIDGYNESHDRQTYPVGTWVLNSGIHYLRFDSKGKNDSSSGYNIGLDQVTLSAHGEPFDVECLLPAYSYSGSAPSSASMNAYSGWRNNAKMWFPATNDTNYVTFQVYNDMWLESTFNFENAVPDDVELVFDSTIGENVCQMSGNTIAWDAGIQTFGGIPADPATTYENSTVRVIIGGADLGVGGNIAYSGAKGKITFRATPDAGKLDIAAAYIMERDSGYNGTGTPVQLTFGDATGNAGQTSVRIDAANAVTSDLFDLAISPDKDYLVSFHIGEHATDNFGKPAEWADADAASSEIHAYHIPHTSGDLTDESGVADWSAYSSSVQEVESVLGVESIFVTYPATAAYTSRVLDTRLDNPALSTVSWRESNGSGTDIAIRVRSGDAADMSDAVAWTSAPTFTDPTGANSLSTVAGGRYVQWQAELTATDPYDVTPKLRDVRILWPGERRGVDVSVALERNTDMGKFSLTIDGRTPAPAALNMAFTAARDTFVGTFTKDFSVDESPRNR